MTRLPRMLLIICLAGALGACQDDAQPTPDTSMDMSTSDAGGERDAAQTSDTGTTPDTGTTSEQDMSNPADTGSPAEDMGEDDDMTTQEDMDMDVPPASTTAGVLCGYGDSGMQRLVYDLVDPRRGTSTPVDEMLAYDFMWSCDATERSLSGNGVPDHAVTGGEFATRVSAQNVSMTVTLTPEDTGAATVVRQAGIALNSVKFDPATAGTCPDDAGSDTDCDYAMGDGSWRMVATPGDVSPWRFDFGVDENDAHVQPTGHYHYHGDPVNLVKDLNPDFEQSMTLVGWAADGFPIYSLRGHSDPQDATSALAIMTSSYRTIATPPANRPSTDDFPLGHFESDWEYVAGSGDLDECNGRFGVTPEFPGGIYHYYTTQTYPFVQRCVRGTASDSGMMMGGGGPGGMMGGM